MLPNASPAELYFRSCSHSGNKNKKKIQVLTNLTTCAGMQCMRKWKSLSRVRLCDPMDYIVHGILQAKILGWVAVPFSSGSSPPRNWTAVSCTTGRFLTSWATREAQCMRRIFLKKILVFYLFILLYNIVLVLPYIAIHWLEKYYLFSEQRAEHKAENQVTSMWKLHPLLIKRNEDEVREFQGNIKIWQISPIAPAWLNWRAHIWRPRLADET